MEKINKSLRSFLPGISSRNGVSNTADIARLYEVLDKNDELIENLGWITSIYKNKDPKKEKVNLRYLEYAKKIFIEKKNDKANEIDEIISNAKNYPENIVQKI